MVRDGAQILLVNAVFLHKYMLEVLIGGKSGEYPQYLLWKQI